MGFKQRGYTREVTQEKVRDYSLFAIATEGTVTEPGYFRPFDGIDRIKVDIIEPEPSEDGKDKNEGSSPKKVLERVQAYIDENQLSADDGDTLWCVIDVDRWPQEQIEEAFLDLSNYAESKGMRLYPGCEYHVDHNMCDNLQGGRLAAQELLDTGCVRPLMIGGRHATENIPAFERFRGSALFRV